MLKKKNPKPLHKPATPSPLLLPGPWWCSQLPQPAGLLRVPSDSWVVPGKRRPVPLWSVIWHFLILQQTEGFKKRWFTMDDRRLMYFKDPLVR